MNAKFKERKENDFCDCKKIRVCRHTITLLYKQFSNIPALIYSYYDPIAKSTNSESGNQIKVNSLQSAEIKEYIIKFLYVVWMKYLMHLTTQTIIQCGIYVWVSFSISFLWVWVCFFTNVCLCMYMIISAFVCMCLSVFSLSVLSLPVNRADVFLRECVCIWLYLYLCVCVWVCFCLALVFFICLLTEPMTVNPVVISGNICWQISRSARKCGFKANRILTATNLYSYWNERRIKKTSPPANITVIANDSGR